MKVIFYSIIVDIWFYVFGKASFNQSNNILKLKQACQGNPNNKIFISSLKYKLIIPKL